MLDLLTQIDAWRPDGDNWRGLDALLGELFAAGPVPLAAVPALLRVLERFPRHDGHGVLWSIVHGVETIAGYEPVAVEYVSRAPTEMGITILRRLVTAGRSHVGLTELAPLIASLEPRAPVIDYALVEPGPPPPARRPIATLVAALHAFQPRPNAHVEWNVLVALVAELLEHEDVAVVTPLLQTLDRFHDVAGFKAFWTIVDGLERMPGFAAALVASVRTTPTRNGTTLLLRLLSRDVLVVDGIDIAELAGRLLAPVEDAPDR